MKVLLLENISAVAVEQFRAAGYEVESLKAALEEGELIEKIRGVSILGVRSKTRVSAAVLEAASVGAGKPPFWQRRPEVGHPREMGHPRRG